MGASGWDYRAPFEQDLPRSLLRLQEEVIASGDYLWPWDDFDDDYLEEGEGFPRPANVEELIAAREDSDFWDGGGTHSILDIAPSDLTPLTSEELRTVFGTEEPGPADLDRVHQPGAGGVLDDLMNEKWTARCMVIFIDAAPAEVIFWGWSGD